LLQRDEAIVAEASRLVGSTAADLVSGVQRRLDEIKDLNDEIKGLRAQLAVGRAVELAAAATDGLVIERIDGLAPTDLRDLAVAVRQQPGIVIVVLGGVSSSGGATLVAAVTSASGRVAGDLIKDAAKAVGGGGGGKGDIATAGGKNVDGLDKALAIARSAATS
jgi:alanyl-tRNA synthetase